MALGHNMHLMVQQQQQQQHHQHHHQIKHTPIAPAPISKNGFNSTPSVLGMNGVNVQSNVNNNQFKKKYTYTNMPYGEQPASVVRRNARERNRVKQVNNGFVTLRQHIPQTIVTSVTNGGRGASKKLSKVDTLRMAVEYIRRLQDLIEDADSDAASTSTYSSQGSTAGSPPPSFYHQNNEQFTMPATYSATSSSPAPSFSSENSIGSGNNYSHETSSAIQQPQYKFEPFEGYNNFQTTSDDEELLDYISFWQEQ